MRFSRQLGSSIFVLTAVACSGTSITQVTAESSGGTTSGAGTSSVAGTSNSGGSSHVGGSSTTGGGASSVGGTSNKGGASTVGGASSTAGTSTTGGSSLIGGTSTTGGSSVIGGTSATVGGVSSTGGTQAITSGGGGSLTGGTSALGSATGGKTATGGASAIGGVTSSGLGGSAPVGGMSSTGGLPATGGVIGTGGKPATGGAATGGAATGGAATGGAATGGVPATGGTTATNTFLSGPCAESPDSSTVEVFALGADKHIHRRVISGSNLGSWAVISGLDGSLVDVRSDLDCSANTTASHIVATNTQGQYLHAIGFGTTYNQFVAGTDLSGLNPSPSVAVGGTSASLYVLAALAGNYIQMSGLPGPTLSNAQVSSVPDIAYQQIPMQNTYFLDVIDASGQLEVNFYGSGSTSSMWNSTPAVLPPPAGHSYAYAPTVCADFNANYQPHFVVVAGSKLWHVSSYVAALSTTTWEQMSAIDVVSAPDCAALSDGTVHAVALTLAGTVVDVSGKSGGWTTTDLGGY